MGKIEVFPFAESEPKAADYGREQWLPVRSLPRTWQQTKGENVFVGVLDTGCEPDHPDLIDGIRMGITGFSNLSSGHGTHVAGIIGARKNGFGLVGVAPECFIIPSKAVPGDWDALAKGLESLLRAGVDIVNMSFGSGDEPSDRFKEQVAKAVAKGVVLIAAAGNSGGQMAYPALMDGVIPVAATDGANKHAPFSSSGSELERGFCAVGVEIMSCWPGKTYRVLSGTSMAAPQISGLAALIIAKHRRKQGSTPVPPSGPERINAVIQHLEHAAIRAGDASILGAGFIDAARL